MSIFLKGNSWRWFWVLGCYVDKKGGDGVHVARIRKTVTLNISQMISG